MTPKELHTQKLVEEANHACLHFRTRRHFIRESAMGLGALALGSLIGCRSRTDDASSILSILPILWRRNSSHFLARQRQ